MTNGQIITLYKGLLAINSLEKLNLPIKVGYIFARNSAILEPIVSEIFKKRRKLLEENGKEEQLGTFNIDEDKREYVQSELDILFNIENPDIKILKLNIEDFKDIELPLFIINDIQIMINEEV